MYVKVFSKILHSSIWLESPATRLVWLTFLVSMDETGFAQFASVGNVSRAANVPLDEARKAIQTLESPDPDSSDPENDGRRLERVPGGWIVLNSTKHREIATRAGEQEQIRLRVAKCRAKKKTTHESVTTPDVTVTDRYQSVTVTPSAAGNRYCNDPVTPTEAEAETEADEEEELRDEGLEGGTEEDPSPLNAALQSFAASWGKYYRAAYRPLPSDPRNASSLTPAQLERLPEALKAYFSSTSDPFYRNNRHPFAVFVSQFDRILDGKRVRDEEPALTRGVMSAEETEKYLANLRRRSGTDD